MKLRVAIFAALVAGILVPREAGAQHTDSLTRELGARMRAEFALWSAGDIDAIVSRGESVAGFGYRSRAARGVPGSPRSWTPEVLKPFFDSLEYYNLELNTLYAEAHGDVIIAWGFFTEDFKRRGHDAERYLIRFTDTLLRKEDGTLASILNHRDIQPFGDDGRYLPRPR